MSGFPKIYLASISPRRRELLARVGIPFEPVEFSYVEEGIPFDKLRPWNYAVTLASEKARSVKGICDGLVLGFDTIVVRRGALFEKPRDADDARRILRKLRGSWHKVFTGIAIWQPATDIVETGFECTSVKFRSLSDREIEEYIASGEPMDKAGAYGIQEKGALLVSEIRGDYFNVVGLPLFRLTLLLNRFNIEFCDILKNNNDR